jgi:hypothetical protein
VHMIRQPGYAGSLPTAPGDLLGASEGAVLATLIASPVPRIRARCRLSTRAAAAFRLVAVAGGCRAWDGCCPEAAVQATPGISMGVGWRAAIRSLRWWNGRRPQSGGPRGGESALLLDNGSFAENAIGCRQYPRWSSCSCVPRT